MDRKFTLVIALLIIHIVSASLLVSAEISVAVKAGDWIEYRVAFTGTPPEGHAVTWARMEVISVQGRNIDVAVAAKQSDGSWLNETVPLNLENGQLGDNFIIPANLNSGDTFYDRGHGEITISGVEEKTYAGAKRTIVSGTVSESAQQATYQTTYYWDRVTGVLVEGNSSYTNFAMHTIVDRTNMWQVQMPQLDSTVFYAIIIAVAVMTGAVLAVFAMRRKK